MGRTAAVTFEQITATAAALREAGVKPTARAIRERLGHVGSMGTIHRLLQSWKATEEAGTADVGLPTSVQGAILDFVRHELAQARAVLEAELAAQRQEAEDLATENERQAAELVEHQAALEAARAEVATARGRQGQLEAELAAARQAVVQERHATEAARIELAKTQLRLEALPRLESELASRRRELEHEHQARVAAEQQVAVLKARLETLTGRVEKPAKGGRKKRA